EIATAATSKAAPATAFARDADRQALVVILVKWADALRPTGSVRPAQPGDMPAVVGGRIGHTLAPIFRDMRGCRSPQRRPGHFITPSRISSKLPAKKVATAYP